LNFIVIFVPFDAVLHVVGPGAAQHNDVPRLHAAEGVDVRDQEALRAKQTYLETEPVLHVLALMFALLMWRMTLLLLHE
jgi:hypothetical protein